MVNNLVVAGRVEMVSMDNRKIRLAALRQVTRFGLIGVLNTVVDVGIFFILVHLAHWSVIPAQTVSYTCGICNSYVWNRYLTFQRKGGPRMAEAFRFVSLNLLSYGISVAILYLFSTHGWSIVIGKGAANLLTLVVNFIGSKWWVFRRQENTPGTSTPCNRSRPGDVSCSLAIGNGRDNDV